MPGDIQVISFLVGSLCNGSELYSLNSNNLPVIFGCSPTRNFVSWKLVVRSRAAIFELRLRNMYVWHRALRNLFCGVDTRDLIRFLLNRTLIYLYVINNPHLYENQIVMGIGVGSEAAVSAMVHAKLRRDPPAATAMFHLIQLAISKIKETTHRLAIKVSSCSR